MSKVLEIMAVEFLRETEEETSPINDRYYLLLPTSNRPSPLTRQEILSIFDEVASSGIIFDYVTVRDGDYSDVAVCLLGSELRRIKVSPDARFNVPARIMFQRGLP